MKARISKYLKIGGIWGKVKKVWNKFGVFLILGLIVWVSPSWLAFFIPALRPFALTWLGLVVSPAVPSYLAVPLLAGLLKLLWWLLLKLIVWLKDQLMKLGFGAELFTLYDKSEIEMILLKGRKMKAKKDKQTLEFKNKLKQERKKLIQDNWEIDLEEVKK